MSGFEPAADQVVLCVSCNWQSTPPLDKACITKYLYSRCASAQWQAIRQHASRRAAAGRRIGEAKGYKVYTPWAKRLHRCPGAEIGQALCCFAWTELANIPLYTALITCTKHQAKLNRASQRSRRHVYVMAAALLEANTCHSWMLEWEGTTMMPNAADMYCCS